MLINTGSTLINSYGQLTQHSQEGFVLCCLPFQAVAPVDLWLISEMDFDLCQRRIGAVRPSEYQPRGTPCSVIIRTIQWLSKLSKVSENKKQVLDFLKVLLAGTKLHVMNEWLLYSLR